MANLEQSSYRQQDCEIGVVHIGFGAFHRAHQAVYIDQLMDKTNDLRWGVAAVNLLASQSDYFAELSKQKDGYILKTIAANGQTIYRKIRAHIDFSDWPTEPLKTEKLLALPNVKLVTITVTESGYALNDQAGLDIELPAIREELLGGKKTTIYAYLRAALHHRRNADAGGITILNCDNLRRNGKLLEQNFLAYLQQCDDHELLDWVTQNVRFPCSMVDRITPRPTNDLHQEITTIFGTHGTNSVMGEDFIQWVIEDDFATDRPALERVGVEIVSDVDPYEETKIRILNGGHTALVYMGALLGYQSFDQLMEDESLLAHFNGFENDEVIPALRADLSSDAPVEFESYCKVIAQRFSNPHIADSVARIAADGFSKFPIFILPTLRSCYRLNITPKRTLTSIAAWYHFCVQYLEGRIGFDYIEPKMSVLKHLLHSHDATAFASSSLLWGNLPTQNMDFVADLLEAIEAYGQTLAPQTLAQPYQKENH